MKKRCKHCKRLFEPEKVYMTSDIERIVNSKKTVKEDIKEFMKGFEKFAETYLHYYLNCPYCYKDTEISRKAFKKLAREITK